MIKTRLGALTIVIALIVLFSIAFVAAQYVTQETTDVTLGSNGTFSMSYSDIGLSYTIQGTPGATGTVIADLYNGNPFPTATIPNGVTLTHFVAITISMDANDFSSATVVLNYKDSDVSGISAPYSVYKYDAISNSFTLLPAQVDTNAKTITFTLTSPSDPLVAIGGSAVSGGVSPVTWAVVAVSVIVIVILAVFIVWRLRKPKDHLVDDEDILS